MEANSPYELVVQDELQRCPYLPDQTARMPLRLPMSRVDRERLDERLACGDRRSGTFIYRAECPACVACEAIRVLVSEFLPSRTQRRVLRKGDQEIHMSMAKPIVDEERVRLFNRHRDERALRSDDSDVDLDAYRTFLVDTCCETVELSYRVDGRLICVAICDQGQTSLSAVYTYFDPDYSSLSPGVYSILKQIELCQHCGLEYLYLGYYVARSQHMAYKVNYRPHERRIGGRWIRFPEPGQDDEPQPS